MVKFLFAVLVLGVAAWIVDSSGCGYWKVEPTGSPQWSEKIIKGHPQSLYLQYKSSTYLITDPEVVRTTLDTLAKRTTKVKVSIFGRHLKNFGPQPNALYVQYFAHTKFTPLLKFGEPADDLGPD